eukprot:6984504-Prymnesium_polylepis.1
MPRKSGADGERAAAAARGLGASGRGTPAPSDASEAQHAPGPSQTPRASLHSTALHLFPARKDATNKRFLDYSGARPDRTA